jgi:hypothetical protein
MIILLSYMSFQINFKVRLLLLITKSQTNIFSSLILKLYLEMTHYSRSEILQLDFLRFFSILF